jgi:carbonic anhydrase
MCIHCGNSDVHSAVTPSRRHILKFATALAASAAVSSPAFAQKKVAPKPGNVLSPDAAFDRLMKGNGRYVSGVSKRHDFKHERDVLTTGQNPFAGILSCADSRIAPEYAFDTARGDLFVCRVAGNFLNDDSIASFEYGVQVLNTPLLVVLGHQDCGAMDAAIKSIKDNTTLPGHLPSLVSAMKPAIDAAAGKPGNAFDNAIRQNVILNVEKMKTATPILSKFVNEKKIRVVGGIYHLDTGRVEIFA